MNRQNVLAALAALGQETRLDLFRLLVQSGPEGLSAGALAARLSIPGPTLSFHLKELKACGLIDAQRKGRVIIYAPSFDRVRALTGYLLENCCGADAKAGADCKPAGGAARRRT